MVVLFAIFHVDDGLLNILSKPLSYDTNLTLNLFKIVDELRESCKELCFGRIYDLVPSRSKLVFPGVVVGNCKMLQKSGSQLLINNPYNRVHHLDSHDPND